MDSSLVTQGIVAGATLLASLGGYMLAGRNEQRRDERTLRREIDLRKAERSAKLETDMQALQRETLLALQDAVQIMARLTGRALHFDHMQARQGNYTQLPDSLNEQIHANGVEVRRLVTRVLDPQVRQAVETFTSLTSRLTISPKDFEGLVGEDLESRAAAKLAALGTEHEALSEVIGNTVREAISWRHDTA